MEYYYIKQTSSSSSSRKYDLGIYISNDASYILILFKIEKIIIYLHRI